MLFHRLQSILLTRNLCYRLLRIRSIWGAKDSWIKFGITISQKRKFILTWSWPWLFHSYPENSKFSWSTRCRSVKYHYLSQTGCMKGRNRNAYGRRPTETRRISKVNSHYRSAKNVCMTMPNFRTCGSQIYGNKSWTIRSVCKKFRMNMNLYMVQISCRFHECILINNNGMVHTLGGGGLMEQYIGGYIVSISPPIISYYK